jgi:hypothetical protein
MLGAIIVLLTVIAIMGWAVYALVHPFTHTHYVHTSKRLWRPLD